MKAKLYRLTFKTPLHLSDLRADYGKSEQRLHSDKLYAAVMQAWAMLGKTEWITQNPPFAISSLFPYATDINKGFVYFFPKPYTLPIKEENKNPDLSKKFKKIQFIDKEYFEQFLNGYYDAIEKHLKGNYLTKSVFSKTPRKAQKENKDEDLEIIISQTVPRIRWNRDEKKDSEPFYMDNLYFSEGSGLWFIFDGNEDIQNRFETALKLLSDEGLGTDRNVGNGRFIYESDILDINLPDEANYCINLSLYCPQNIETLKSQLIDNEQNQKLFLDNNTGYDFIKRGGWISEPYNSFRKRYIYMFSEGSVFKKFTKGMFVTGESHDVTPEIIFGTTNQHKIFRSGKAIFLPVKFV